MNRRNVTFLIGQAILCCALGCITASAAGDWTTVRSANFQIIGNAPEVELKSVAIRLEEFRNIFSRIFPSLHLGNDATTTVVVFKDAAAYQPFKPLRPGGLPDNAVAGYFIAGDDTNYIAVSLDPSKSDPYQTVFHEYLHFLLKANAAGEIPAWLNEGFAEYFQTIRQANERAVVLGDPPAGYDRLLRGGSVMMVDSLLSMDNTALRASDDPTRTLFYAQAWSLVSLLIQNDAAVGDDRFLRLLSSILRGNVNSADALREFYKMDPTAVDKLLRVFVDQPLVPEARIDLPGAPASVTKPTAAPLPDSAANGYLGDLLRHAGRPDDAESYLRKALTLDGRSMVARFSLGMVLLGRERFADAADHFEIAIRDPSAHAAAFFYYAYALSRMAGGDTNKVTKFEMPAARKMIDALQRSIELAPNFVDSYRLLAFVKIVNGDDLDGAAAVLKKGLTVQPGNAELQLLLARALLRQERYIEARAVAEGLSATTTEPRIKAEAAEILSAVAQYVRATVEISGRSTAVSPWRSSLVLLKRSWLGDGDIERIEKDRVVNNLNRALERPAAGETQMVGRIDRVTCSGDRVSYSVSMGSRIWKLKSVGFQQLRMAVLLEGENSFQIDCGVSFSRYLTVLTYRPGRIESELTSVTFVPDEFELKTPEQMSGARTVVVEDDRLGRDGQESTGPAARWSAISANLRRVASGEERRTATLDEIDCEAGIPAIIVTTDARKLRLQAGPNGDVKIGWFTAAETQTPLTCGGRNLSASVLVTFVSGTAGGRDPELRAIEFIPEGFSPSNN